MISFSVELTAQVNMSTQDEVMNCFAHPWTLSI